MEDYNLALRFAVVFLHVQDNFGRCSLPFLGALGGVMLTQRKFAGEMFGASRGLGKDRVAIRWFGANRHAGRETRGGGNGQ